MPCRCSPVGVDGDDVGLDALPANHAVCRPSSELSRGKPKVCAEIASVTQYYERTAPVSSGAGQLERRPWLQKVAGRQITVVNTVPSANGNVREALRAKS